MTKDQIDAMYERLNPKPKKDDHNYGYFSVLNDWYIKREGFRQMAGLLEPEGLLPHPTKRDVHYILYRIREDRNG